MSEALVILFVLFLWTAILTVIAVALRLLRGRPTAEQLEVEELRARYARGEIPYAQYDRRRRELGKRPPAPRPIENADAGTPGERPAR
jgi:uncharacterized membrane protein